VINGRVKVVVAPDSFKGSTTAREAADALARGVNRVRPDAEIVAVPQADGGEGTLDAILRARSDAAVHRVEVHLPPGPHDARWLMLPGLTAVVELAECCGLPLVGTASPRHASSAPVGEALRAALAEGARRIVLAVGGSASTDGGSGCLTALGLRVRDRDGRDVPAGGAGLVVAAAVEDDELCGPPPDGVTVLCDVDAPLFGPRGAAHVFGPQKGATAGDVAFLDEALRRWAALLGGDPERPGSGAAGGIAYGLARFWPTELAPGADHVIALTGLADQIAGATLVITGEGQHDAQSYGGKATGSVVRLAEQLGVRTAVAAGRVTIERPGVEMIDLSVLAGSAEASMADPLRYLQDAGELIAGRLAR